MAKRWSSSRQEMGRQRLPHPAFWNRTRLLHSSSFLRASALVRLPSNWAAPIELGGYLVDDVQLTAIRQPALPIRFVN